MALTSTGFAFEASGYASRVVGGDVAADSDRTAFQVLGCTNKAGLDKENTELDVNEGGLHLSSATTRVWTTTAQGSSSSWSSHTLEKVTLADTPAGELSLTGLSSVSRAWHDGSGYHGSSKTRLGAITLNPVDGPDVAVAVPLPGSSVRVPGVATVKLLRGQASSDSHGAMASTDAVKVTTDTTGTVTYLAHSRATIAGPVKGGLFGGSAFGTQLDSLDGTVTSGATPYLVMPCQGTSGRILSQSIARSNLGHGITARLLTASERARERTGTADAWTRSSIAKVALGSGLVVRGVVARAHVVRTSSGVETDTRGSEAAKVYYQGNRITIPADGRRIRGVALIQPHLVHRTSNSIEVTALRVTLLDGRALVVDVGHAKARIASSGR